MSAGDGLGKAPGRAGGGKAGSGRKAPAKPRAAKVAKAGPSAANAAPGEQISSAACPICGKPGSETYRPFCSKHCADVDLNRWLSGSYAIPATTDDDEDGRLSDDMPDVPDRDR